ncbi:MAG: hypothetical protein IAB80_06505 [Bacteroidetes bacterium]|uniref:ATP synthase F1 complex delta/epsilon subunit N-terminal domain-containing protein n=1 Tax=Candidatus Cryptobacteroides excrementipullorum TaxID=2840761 RepID=A0A9D9NLV7_9BACT|nr:hypothetical protein [Candidatus Cryptobacteroides excrementipullorum]
MDNKGGIYLTISSPEAHLLGQMVNAVTLPGITGKFCVLHDHAPLIAALGDGDIEYKVGEETQTLHVKSGFAEVSDNTVSVCVEI